MITTTRVLRLGMVAAAVAVLPAPAAQAAPEINWRPCAQVAKDWPYKDDSRTECAELTVPLDYAKPQGRKTTVAVSRVKATGPAQRKGAIFFSTGGPGIGNLTGPHDMTERRISGLNTEYDFLGMDPRGTGYSEHISCPAPDPGQLPPTATAKERARSSFDYEAGHNKRCAATDPEFVRQLTPDNAARDVDAFRAALGEQKIGFYGISYGTLIGTRFRALFDDRVDKMLLDSGMPPVQDHTWMDESIDQQSEAAFPAFLTWLAKHDPEYHFGSTAAAVRKTLFDLRAELGRNPRLVGGIRLDAEWASSHFSASPAGYGHAASELAKALEGGAPAPAPDQPAKRAFGLGDPHNGMNALQYNAMMCNQGTGARDFDAIWANNEDRQRRYPATGGGNLTVWCAQWPWPGQALRPVRGKSPLQHVGHLDEGSTPYPWTVATRNAVGGALLTVLDDSHGSLSKIPCAAKAVDFFRTGRTTEGSCPGTS
ncbi:alpha/beta hydrolase [Crossiella sp. SN42]|uniref:alpha/beta fold hydrolase n=1 Tax=Crossiella sp. SN42 TaxID=2944808 RepID=UPI00207D2432|nr:alpha/beta fold hydrolase [Crossiella sp. SN42]MCO1577458.1 alpha/beta hydrolase [Crossiella sp. SN42]